MDIAYDIETYPNCFILCALAVDGCSKWEFEVSPWRNDTAPLLEWLSWMMNSRNRMVGFNNIGFDYPILHMLWGMKFVHPHMLYERAVAIIAAESGDRFANIVRPSDVLIPQVDLFKVHHFDNRARQTSLKALEFNMRMENISDLPFPPGTTLDNKQCAVLREYCSHDVKATVEFYHKSKDAIAFREKLAEKYEGDFLNYSDVKIGKTIFQKTLEAAGVQTYEYSQSGRQPKQSPRPTIKLADCVPKWVQFEHPEFQRIRSYFEQQVITQTKGTFDNLKAHVAGLDYWFGTGGLHASVENEFFESNEEMMIFDMDVTSLYPSIAIENSYYPEHLGPTFVNVYRNMRAQRLQYAKGTPENNMLKLALNGVYGASGDKFSIFYDPLFTMRITIGGQLMLSMLIEHLTAIEGLRVIQANTDGITVHAPRSSKFLIDAVCAEWERQTRLSLEYAEYSKMAIADVNSYVAQKPNGEVKRKGRYEYDLDWHQNASALVIPKVAEKVILEGVTVMDTLLEWPDLMDFMLRVKVLRSSRLVIKEGGDEMPLENTQRYYVSQSGGYLFKIMPPLATKPNDWRRIAVESGFTVCPCNNMKDARLPINYHWYAAEIEKLTLGVI